jgi:hypothetical protein
MLVPFRCDLGEKKSGNKKKRMAKICPYGAFRRYRLTDVAGDELN